MRFDEEDASGTPLGYVTGLVNQQLLLRNEVPRRGKLDSALAFAEASALDQHATNHSGRNRQRLGRHISAIAFPIRPWAMFCAGSGLLLLPSVASLPLKTLTLWGA